MIPKGTHLTERAYVALLILCVILVGLIEKGAGH